MKMIHAVFENGVFRPLEPVTLPEGCEVMFEPRPADASRPGPSEAEFAHMEPGLARTYAILSERYDSGRHDLAQRHGEHQP